jgi:hypothetical protein
MARVATKKSKVKVSKEIIDKLSESGVSPVEVMVNSMRKLFREYTDAEEQAELTNSQGEKEAILKQAKDSLTEACEIAKNVAPYFHPRLQSVTVAGDGDGAPISVELSNVDELRRLIRGGTTPNKSNPEDK